LHVRRAHSYELATLKRRRRRQLDLFLILLLLLLTRGEPIRGA